MLLMYCYDMRYTDNMRENFVLFFMLPAAFAD